MALFSPLPDRRAYQMEWWAKRAVGGRHRPAEDPHQAGPAGRNRLDQTAQLRRGRVVDAVAAAHCYKVQFESGCPPRPCVLGALTALLPLGARQLNTLVLGSTVWAIVHPQFGHGVIVAVEPRPGVDPTLALGDALHGSSRCGVRVDRTHSAVFRLHRGGGVVDWSAGRPYDGTTAGEWGAIAETGLRVALDSYMAQLAVDEATGVFAFYHDQLLRLAGHNLQVRSAGSEEEWLDDRGEVLAYRGWTPYPWEHRGALDPAADPFRDLTPRACQVDEPHYGPVEPVHDDQQPFARVLELGGYVGQGGKRLVLLPPPAGSFYRYGADGAAPVAVGEEHWSLAGRYTLRAAGGITLAKRIAIPGPRRRARPEAIDAAAPPDYRPAGLGTAGPAHRVTAGVTASADDPQLQQAAAATDARAHGFNWEAEHALHYHGHDWHLPEEAATPAGTNQRPLAFGRLGTSCYLDRPEPIAQHVDHRYGAVDYYPNESYLSLLDDGGVVLGDGYGAEIRMTGGHLFLTAPGDVWLKPGRNANVWAGRDAIVRARNAVDVSATERGVRIKAETDCQILAGNDGAAGAVLIESRAPAAYDYADVAGDDVRAGGIHLKSARGAVVAWARDIYLRTGGGDVAAGAITLDAARGQQPLYSYSSDAVRYVAGGAFDHFGVEGAVTHSNRYDPGFTLLGGALAVDGYTEVLKDGLGVRGFVAVAAGHIATELAPQYNYLVAGLDRGLPELVAQFDEARDAEARLNDAGAARWRTAFGTALYGAGRPGADATIRAVGFGFRTAEQYRTEDFRLYEDRWQQLARLGGGAPAVWTERPVRAGATETYPYPGSAAWAEAARFFQQDLVLYDPAAGVARPRDPALYGDARFASPAAVPLDGHYAVID